MAEIQGVDIGFYVRDFGSTDQFQRLVCEDTLVFDLTSDVTTTKTKCGTFKGLLVPEFKVSGSAVCNFTPTSSEYSHDEMINDMNAVQKKEFRIKDIATNGGQIRLAGGGFFSTEQITFNNGEVCKFSYNFEGVGIVDASENS